MVSGNVDEFKEEASPSFSGYGEGDLEAGEV